MGIHLSRVKFLTTLSTIFTIPQYPFPNFASYTSFLEPPIEEKSELEKSIEANVQEAERQFQKMMASRISQYFQESNPVPPLQNDQISLLELTEELLRESERQSQNLLDSQSSQIFQKQDSYTPFLEQPFKESEVEKSIEILHETSQ